MRNITPVERQLNRLNVGEGLTVNHPEQVPIYEWLRVPGGLVCTTVMGDEHGKPLLLSSCFVPRPETEEVVDKPNVIQVPKFPRTP